MEFICRKKEARFLDPFNGFNEGTRECEIREDPLTGRNSRILYFPLHEFPEPDLSGLIEKSSGGICPFCPDMVEKITPKYDPDRFTRERYRVGRAICFPNAFPYDENGSVTVISEDHFLLIREFTADMIRDAISCCVEFLKDVSASQPEAVYQSINWNYLPLAGSSIVHPHLQITASTSPTNYYTDVYTNWEKSGRSSVQALFNELVEEEKERQVRFLDENGMFSWLLAFAPMGVFDVMGIPGQMIEPADLRGSVLDDLVDGIMKSINFIDSVRLYSFNMSIYFQTGSDSFYPHVRICPRASIPPLDTSEINYMKMLHSEPMSPMVPEVIAGKLKEFWKSWRPSGSI